MAELTDRDIDVAEKVMGWTKWTTRSGKFLAWDGWFDSNSCERKWSPTKHPDHDYIVLEHVRNHWTAIQMTGFVLHLRRAHYDRQWPMTVIQTEMGYLPGDYARAALAVVESEAQHG